MNTAHEYSDGASERIVGRWIRERGIRSEMIVTSKGGEDRRVPGSLAMHRADLLEDVDESLMRAGFDYFDFYLLHVDDVSVSVEEVVSTMEDIQKSGKIRYYGCSNWTGALAKLAEDGNTERWSAGQKVWYDLPYNHKVACRLKKLSEETGYTVTQLQLAYVLAQPHGFSNFVISGSANMEQLIENMGEMQIDMTSEMIQYLQPKDC